MLPGGYYSPHRPPGRCADALRVIRSYVSHPLTQRPPPSFFSTAPVAAMTEADQKPSAEEEDAYMHSYVPSNDRERDGKRVESTSISMST